MFTDFVWSEMGADGYCWGEAPNARLVACAVPLPPYLTPPANRYAWSVYVGPNRTRLFARGDSCADMASAQRAAEEAYQRYCSTRRTPIR